MSDSCNRGGWWAPAAALLVLVGLSGCEQKAPVVDRVGTPYHKTPGTLSVAVPGVQVLLPPITGRERPVRRAGAPGEPLAVLMPGPQTLLVHCAHENVPAAMEEIFTRTHVIVLDGPLAKGTVEVTPANGRLIEASTWRPARQPYTGLEGSLRIVSVSGSSVLADCSIRNIIHRSGDPVYPLRGLYRFRLTAPEAMPAGCNLAVQGGLAAPATQEGAP